MHSKTKSNVALCYVRQSFTRDDDDKTSPERQKAQIQKLCDERGWTAEFYEDVGGHKSGTSIKGRPAWQQLQTRIADDDVVAIVAYDLSRLHRKGWRIGELVDMVQKHNLELALTDDSQGFDFSSMSGKMLAMVIGIMDEWYAADTARKARSSIEYRKAQGKSVGMPPFGTVRNDEGYLVASEEGCWLMPDGSFVDATKDEQPAEDAVWRSYYESAHEALKRYAENTRGINSIYKELVLEGYPYQNRKGKSKKFTRGAVRRIISNWAEYAGYVGDDKARDRHPFEHNPDTVDLIPERAVFDVSLLVRVGNIRKQRSRSMPRRDNRRQFAYPLSGIVYCYHCNQRAAAQDDYSQRSLLHGYNQKRYRHRAADCNCNRKSVKRELLETDFERLINALTVSDEQLQRMKQIAQQLDTMTETDTGAIERKKERAIKQAQVKIENAKKMALNGLISYEEAAQHIKDAEREIAAWKSRTSETEQKAVELVMCADAISKLHDLWRTGDNNDKQDIVQHTFDYIVYNLDAQRITDFKLKSWADNFLSVSSFLYSENEAEGSQLPHRSLKPARLISTDQVSQAILHHIYSNITRQTTAQRNEEIKKLYASGISLSEIATQYSLSAQRIHQIVNS